MCGGGSEGPWRGAAIVYTQLLSLTWGPPVLWGMLSSKLLAPAMQDYYYERNTTALLFSNAPGGRPKLSALLFVPFYAVPVGASLCLMAIARFRDRRSPARGLKRD